MGDFNLNYSKIYISSYNFHNLYEKLIETFEPLGLMQLIVFKTWSNFVNCNKRSSIIDNIFTSSPHLVTQINSINSEIEDHLNVTFHLLFKKAKPKVTMKWDWHNYNKYQ